MFLHGAFLLQGYLHQIALAIIFVIILTSKNQELQLSRYFFCKILNLFFSVKCNDSNAFIVMYLFNVEIY